MSLRLDILKSLVLEDRNPVASRRAQAEEDPDDEYIYVVSTPGTPARSRAPSRPTSRPVSPNRRSHLRDGSLSLITSRPLSSDPLRAFPTQVSQRIFRWLTISDLAASSRVSRKWNKSQTLNYIWFQHYRKENFHDDSLPPGKWTRRESKENWRLAYLNLASNKEAPSTPIRSHDSGRNSPSGGGYQTPKERNEERWRVDEEVRSRPNKIEMREMYKELGGRKARSKVKLGSTGGTRDKTGWADGGHSE